MTKVEETEDGYAATGDRLRELGLDHADLVVIHRPPPSGAGESIWEGLIRAREEGLAREVGVSNYTTRQMDRITEASGVKPTVNQIEWSPFGHSKEMLGYCREHEVLIQAYSPLTRGQRLADGRLGEIAASYGRMPAQVLLRWDIQLGAQPIPKASTRPHLEQNLDVFDFTLSDGDMEELAALNERYSSLGGLPYV